MSVSIFLLCAAAPLESGLRAATFPLKVSGDHRHLVDGNSTPFLVVGDTAWSMVAQLSEDDIARYLDDRARRGFNAIIVNLIEHKFASRAPANRDGASPFLAPGDFARPNPVYFEFARRAVAAAQERGITVWLCPAYLGWGGGDEGFFKEIKAAGPSALRQYGRFIGERFKDLPNVVWMVGGDYALPREDRWTGAELSLGLREGGATQLITGHGGQTSAVETFGDEPWLAMDTAYGYQPDIWRLYQRTYARQPVRPFVLIESTYEGEHKARPEQVRRQAWWAMLSGACGQFFGNNPMWHFDGPGLFKVEGTWQQALDGTGSRDMARLGSFFSQLPWEQLRPDTNETLVASGRGAGTNYIAAASSLDGNLAVFYFASDGGEPREVRLDLSRMASPLQGRWCNPARDAAPIRVEGSLPNQPGVSLRTPGDNGTGVNDWALVVEREPFRRPVNETELRAWLENMLVYHRFSADEVIGATGLTPDEVKLAVTRFGLQGKDPAPRQPGEPLRVLPYPGGRHPRLGFFDGAILPQRETKLSVFTPWDDASYAVVDVPEAIFSNLGLTYLAHTHIPTIWDTQGVRLPRLEWQRRPDGAFESERILPNGIAFGAKVRPLPTDVRFGLWLRNGTSQTLTGLRVQNCVMLGYARGFAAQTTTNKVFHSPYAAVRSEDGRRWIITAWDPVQRCWGNEKCPCVHSDPQFPDCAPGETVVVRGWLSFYEGGDLEGELARIEKTVWR